MAQDDPDTGDTDKSTKWAENRTDWAEDRTILAVERTFAGWMRTAFAAIGIGLAFRVLFGAFEPPWLAKAIATMFIALGGALAIGAERRTRKAFAKLSSHKVVALGTPKIRWIGWLIAASTIVLIAGLWVLNDGDLKG
ncbi:YidH family protein [Qipengyuania marisflavi]|uniref:DUF202 domain-containing protein n=1 Tax=Qipengyuania marisflavi TaxID=2486356 RepID=A0A5S3P4V8_9SPHN|nr:DUF202 domain-containing protein [Qipengyuania marisflavi]TMM48037.1 DUF202 domain-containing protein [Qipengyuania marisflavi]